MSAWVLGMGLLGCGKAPTVDSAAAVSDDTGAATADSDPADDSGAFGDDTADPGETADPADTDPGETADTGGVFEPGWYVDCQSGDDDADGRSPATALASLDAVNALVFSPGDAIWFKRGTTCAGQLAPSGSGSEGAPVTVGAWGDGAPPIIDGAGHQAALALRNRSHWTIGQLELTGSGPYGVWVTADTDTVRGITLVDLQVHGVNTGGPINARGEGLVVVTATGPEARFEDVLIDGVTAWDTDRWAGIFVYGTLYDSKLEQSDRVVVRGSTVHDVQGTGIALLGARDSAVESSVVYRTGLQKTETVGGASGVRVWYCDRCIVQYSEGYQVSSPDGEAAIFQIDQASTDSAVQYSYGHDAQGACVAVVGAGGRSTTDAVVRYNLCADNGQGAPGRGDISVRSASGGDIDGVQIYSNTLSWSAGGSWAPVVDSAQHVGAGPRFFRDNVVVTDAEVFASTTGVLDFDHNLWWSTAPVQARFEIDGGRSYQGVAGWQAAGRGAGSLEADPLLAGGGGAAGLQLSAGSPAIDAGVAIDGAGGCDYWGGAVGAAPDMGAHEHGAASDPTCGP